MAPKRKSTLSWNPLRSEASISSDPTSSLVPWWASSKGLLGELFQMRTSFKMSSHFVGLLRHWPTLYHSQSGLRVAVWHLSHLSIRVDLGVLLQHAWIWLFSTSVCHSRLRYVHSCHTGYCIYYAPCPEGRASWLPQLWASVDSVQRRAYFCFLWAPF